VTQLESGRVAQVGDEEALARFAVSKSQFSRLTKRPKPNLLTPNPYIELSVSRIDDLDQNQAQALGDDVAKKLKKSKEAKALGYAQLTAKAPRSIGLEVCSAEPPPHHANIVGWSENTDKTEKKRQQLEKAKALVEMCSMHFFDLSQ
jgi:hypothetical protein